MEVAYTYDGSFEGLFSAIFAAYANREDPQAIVEEGGLQTSFGQQHRHIPTDEAHAVRVERGISAKLGSEAYQNIWTAFLSPDPDKALYIYRYVRAGLSMGRTLYTHLSHPDVLAIGNLCRFVEREAHLLKGFTRFSLMENGVYYGKITPKGNAIPLLMPFFADRFSVQPFVLHDPGHQLAGVYDQKSWYMVETAGLSLPDLAEGELEWQRLWRSFYDAVGIPERANPRCRRTHMPKRYWPNMVEMRGRK